MKEINDVFDEIHCILTLDNKERVNNVKKIFKEYNINNVKYTYTFNKPIYRNIRESYPSIIYKCYEDTYIKNKNVYNRVFDCALNHYNIIKSAYLRNLNNILVFEDDINFIVNKDIVTKVINSMPNNYDILKFYNGDDELHLEITNENNIEFIKKFDTIIDDFHSCDFYSCIMVGYSKKGMKAYIDQIETYGIAACDIYYKNLIDENNINVYRLTTYFINPVLTSFTLENI